MVELATADGFCWRFQGTNEKGAFLVSRLARVMHLSQKSATAFQVRKTKLIKKVAVIVLKREVRWLDFPQARANEIDCRLGPVPTSEKMILQLMRVAQIVASSSERNGGLLVHGALAEWNGAGVILAGPGGVGKTTASLRLPHPWLSLCDDTTLIVKTSAGEYWAHPWPTWSQLNSKNMDGTWNVRGAVKLGLICMLHQGRNDMLISLPPRQVISELVDVSGQTFLKMANGMDQDAIRRINLMRFHNAIAISKNIPVCRLEIGKYGKFWNKIELFLCSLAKIGYPEK